MDKFKGANVFLTTLVPLLFLFFFHPLPAHGTEPFPFNYVSPEVDRTLLQAESLVMARRYDEGRALFDGLEREETESLLPSLGRLLILMAHYLEKNAAAEELEEGFRAEFGRNRRILKAAAKRGDLTAWDHFLMGGSLGVQGLYEMEHSRYLPAFLHGFAALSHFGEALRLDPEIEDIYFATGLFKYFRSVKTRYLWFLPLVRDQRKEGIAEIERALTNGHYARPACKIALVVLAEREGQYEKGARRGKVFLEEYPGCLLIREALARIYEKQGMSLAAARVYREGYSREKSVRWVLLEAGRAFYLAKALEGAEESFREYLASDPSPPEAARAHMALSRVYQAMGDPSRSQAERDRALLLDPSLGEKSSGK